MFVQDAVPPGLAPCPTCGKDDEVRAVPAVYEAARATEETLRRAGSVIRDDDASSARKAAARESIAATTPPPIRSALLAPTPPNPVAGYAAGAVFLAIPAAFLWTVYKSSEDFADSTGMAGARSGDSAICAVAIILTALSARLLIRMLIHIRKQRGVKTSRPAAEAVWRRGWYCGRCAVIHFRPSEQPDGAEPGQALSPEQFQDLVWATGGYSRRPGR